MDPIPSKSRRTSETLTHDQLVQHHRWHAMNRRWVKCKHGFTDMAIDRFDNIHPHQTERFALRLLLEAGPGPKSYEELRRAPDDENLGATGKCTTPIRKETTLAR